jgi:hypothetical protein
MQRKALKKKGKNLHSSYRFHQEANIVVKICIPGKLFELFNRLIPFQTLSLISKNKYKEHII